MKPHSFKREVLLVTTSSLSKRQFCEKDPQEKNDNLSPAEQLEAACWNGVLYEILPEIMHDLPCGEKIYLWQVEMKHSCLRLNMGAIKPEFEKEFTLDPNVLIYTMEMN